MVYTTITMTAVLQAAVLWFHFGWCKDCVDCLLCQLMVEVMYYKLFCSVRNYIL